MAKGQSKSNLNDLSHLSESEAHRRLEDITRLVSDWIWEVDQHNNLSFISERVMEYLGYHPRELLGKKLEEVIDFNLPSTSTLSGLIHRPFRNKPGTAIKKNGEICHLSISGVPVFNFDTGDFEGVRGTAVDTTANIEAEKNLRDNEQRYRSLIEFQPTGILVHRNFKIVFANEAAIRMFGADSLEDFLGRTSEELTHPDYHDIIVERRHSVEEKHQQQDFREIKHIRLDGSEFYAMDNAAPTIWENEPSILVSISDITDLKEAERAVAESEKRFREFAETAADRFWETDPENRFTFISIPTHLTPYFDTEALIGKSRLDLPVVNPDSKEWQKHKQDIAAHRPYRNFHFQVKNDDGEIRYLVASGTPQFDTDGTFLGYRGTTDEETEQILAKEKIIDLQQQFFTAIENFSEGFALWDKDGKFVYCNSYFRLSHPSAQRYLIPGETYRSFTRAFGDTSDITPESSLDDWIKTRLEEFEHESADLEMFRNEQWVRVRKNRMADGSMMVLYSDITELKNREQALRDSEDRLHTITDAIPAMIAYHDKDSRFQFANKYFETIGIEPDKIVGQKFQEVFSPEVYARVKPYIEKTLAGEPVTYDNFIPTKDGKVMYTQVSLIPDFDDTGDVQGMFVLSFDITERKKSEEEVEKAKGALDIAQSIAKIGSWERNFAEKSIYWSDEHYRIFGLDPAGKKINVDQFFDLIHPDDRERMRKLAPNEISELDSNYSNDFRIIRPDGTERMIHGEGKILFDEQSHPIGIRGTSQDITERKRVEEALEEAHREAEFANKAKSDFLSSMSHELRTPMNAILGYAQLLLQNKKELLQDRQPKQVGQILKSGQHLLKLINDILDLAKIESGRVAMEFMKVETSEVIEECIGVISSLAERHNIEIKLSDFAAPDLVVTADRTRLNQAMLNLLSNAIKYNKPGGSIKVSSAPTADQKIRITVEDTGIGIPLERQAEIFEPFSRLGADQMGIEGTGIGLTITKQLIELMDGEIGFHSTFDEGSSFWIELPISKSIELAEKPSNFNGQGLENVYGISADDQFVLLYIEDDSSNLHLMEEFIDNVPYLNLLTATSAEDGLDIARQQRPDIIIMDINLPGMSGIDAMAFLSNHKDTKEIPVIALSAAAMPHDLQKGKEAGFFNYMTKPFDIEEVLKNINKALKISN